MSYYPEQRGGRGGYRGGGSRGRGGRGGYNSAPRPPPPFPKSLIVDGALRVRYPDDFIVNREAVGGRFEGMPQLSFYALAEDEATRHSGAYGVHVGDETVTVAIAYVDPASALGDAGFARYWEHARTVQVDFYGALYARECNDGAACTRGGCSFKHGRPDDKDFSHAQVKVVPPAINKANGGSGMSFTEDSAMYAVVLFMTFPRTEDRILWQQPIGEPEFRCGSVTIDSVWRDSRVAKMATKEFSFDDEGSTRDFNVMKQFCENQTFGGNVDVMDSPLGSAFNKKLSVASTPNFGHGQFVAETRTFLSLRRFMLDCLTDTFNESARQMLAASRDPPHLISRCWRVPAELDSFVGPVEGALCKATLCGLPLSMFTHSLTPTFEFLPASQITSGSRVVRYAKFNTPLKDFQSIHNISALVRCIKQQHHGQFGMQLDHATWNEARARLDDLASRESDKLQHVERQVGQRPCVVIPGQDGSVILGTSYFKIDYAAADTIDQVTVRV